MKTEVNERVKPTYPCIKIHGERIVLFVEANTGTVLHEGQYAWGIGHYSHQWDEANFKPFAGDVKLSNN